ncbi:MAG: glycosyl hydrolase [Phycisphaerae bacterium]|nr:glycosyl hydrolase [Phycisphaerae bacterium]MDW8262875.1 glycosyl hydrolase [Phycisphaerales bacterium]
MRIESSVTISSLARPLGRVFDLAAGKLRAIEHRWDPARGAPVFTVKGRYTTRGWTEWTEGFLYGSALYCFDATGDRQLLDLALQRIVRRMPIHVTHTGVHDHGFNNLSTFGNLRRLIREGTIAPDPWQTRFCELAIKASGAVQAARWQGVRVETPSPLSANAGELGYVYSFNGPHSLFVDTMRTLRILGLAWQLGHRLMHENDHAADLLKRSVLHGLTTNQFLIFHGGSGHTYDVRGRTSHEAIFNRNDGRFRCRGTQQGYSPFSTWTRGLAWAMLGYAEELEFFATIDAARFERSVGLPKRSVMKVYEQAAIDTCDHYIDGVTARDGVPYWDDGAPGLSRLGPWRDRPADPFNDHEPVDSSAAAIAAQGLLRLGRYLGQRGSRYTRAGLTVARTLLKEPYLSVSPRHEGLLLHSVYHRPNNWDYVPRGRKVPCGESSLWGDYHLLELCLYLKRLLDGRPYLKFFD